MTKNGKVILDVIESSTCHPMAEEVYRITFNSGNKMSMATFYNNPSRLCSEEYIRRLTNTDQPDRFDKLPRHDHLVCSRCGRISDLFLGNLTGILKKEAGVEFSSYDLKFIYECDECRDKS